jgi:hypothetical protein
MGKYFPLSACSKTNKFNEIIALSKIALSDCTVRGATHLDVESASPTYICSIT